MKLKLDDAAVDAVRAELTRMGAAGEKALAALDARGKREVFSLGGVGVTAATVAALGAGFLLGLWLG